MSDNVAKAEKELEFAKLAAEYDACAADDPRRKELAQAVAAARQDMRRMRDAQLQAEGVAPGDAVATPAPVSGTSGVNESEGTA
jgi:hypothetical protein